MVELAAWVEAGPDPERDGVVRWRRQTCEPGSRAPLGVEAHERTVGKHLAALGYRRLSVRPRHPKADPTRWRRLKKLPGGGSGGDPEHARAKPLESAAQSSGRDAILDHPDVIAIGIVGATSIAEYIYGRDSANGKRAQCFGGARTTWSSSVSGW